MTRWRNWSGRVSCRPDSLHEPATKEELEQLVRRVTQSDSSLRAVGSGHSFTPLAETGDQLISLANLSGLVDVDRETKSATVRAGTTLHDLGNALYDRGFALRNLGDIDRQTLAGAISTGTHGTGISEGILSTQLRKIELITPAEGRVTCSTSKSPDLFEAAQVSLGTLGVLTELTVDVEPAYNLCQEVRKLDLSECLSSLDDLREDNRHFEFFWFPGTETTLVKTLNRTDRSGDVPDWTIGEFLENGLFEGICRVGSTMPSLVPGLNALSARLASTPERTGPAHRVFPSRRLVRFNEMEYGVPANQGREAFEEIKGLVNQDYPDVQFPVEFRYVRGDDIPLSPAHGGDRAFIAVHRYHRKPHEEFFRAAESIFEQHDGRPHWGKIHYRDAEDLSRLYPRWDDFQSVRSRLDPHGVLMTDYLSSLLKD